MKNKIEVQGIEISCKRFNEQDYISLTDLARYKTDAPDRVISTWLRIYNTICYLGTWEIIHNPDFKPHIYEGFKAESAENSFWLSPQKWVENTNAIGIFSKAGRYDGGTFAHRDIAFKFASWLSVEFELYVIEEFQRLKQEKQAQIEWSAKRELAKINYHIHTDAIKENLILPALTQAQKNFVYADEADVLNVALFGKTAKEWRNIHPNEKENMRDSATLHELLVLANMESHNATFITEGLSQGERLERLRGIAERELKVLFDHVKNSPLLLDTKN